MTHGHLAGAAAPLLLALLLFPFAGSGTAFADEAQPAPAVDAARGDEVLEYRGKVQGFFGAVAGLFFPAEGEGRLTRRALPNGNSESELWITSQADDEPDYFRYGAETSGANGDRT